jgi:hypothetical protein
MPACLVERLSIPLPRKLLYMRTCRQIALEAETFTRTFVVGLFDRQKGLQRETTNFELSNRPQVCGTRPSSLTRGRTTSHGFAQVTHAWHKERYCVEGRHTFVHTLLQLPAIPKFWSNTYFKLNNVARFNTTPVARHPSGRWLNPSGIRQNGTCDVNINP